MPKETGRTRKIKEVISRLASERRDWSAKELRSACLTALEIEDAKERKGYAESIRHTVLQMRRSGALSLLDAKPQGDPPAEPKPVQEAQFEISLPREAVTATPAKKRRERNKRGAKQGVEKPNGASAEKEMAAANEDSSPTEAANRSFDTAPLPTNIKNEPEEKVDAPTERAEAPVETAQGPTASADRSKVDSSRAYRGPKGKEMRLYLAELLLSEEAMTEDAISSAAVRRFGAQGERVNGVGGLAKQQLREGVKEGWLVGSAKDGYRLAPPSAVAEAVPSDPTEQSAAATEPEREESKAQSEPPKTEAAPRKRRTRAQAKPIGRRAAEQSERESASAPRSQNAPLNEARFAELINRRQQSLQKQTGDNTFFAEYAARLLEAHFCERGLTVTGRFVVDGADDKGADVVLHTVDELGICDVILVQAKTRSVGQVTLKELREFYGVMSSERATRGIFITTAGFTTDAVTFIRENRCLGAIDKHKLFDLARRYGVGLVAEGGGYSADPNVFS